MGRKTLISWSTGKDSAWALHILRQDPTIEIAGLFCTINQAFDRVAIHGVRAELLKRQAERVNLPLHILPLPHPCSNQQYIDIMTAFIEEAQKEGIECFAFGDLFLEDVRRYRETMLQGTGVTPLFPLWGMPTRMLSTQMIASGLKAVITCVDLQQLPREFAGKEYDTAFLANLPDHIDPCGENGEFHSFAFDGPMFQSPIKIALGETLSRENAFFIDLLPIN